MCRNIISFIRNNMCLSLIGLGWFAVFLFLVIFSVFQSLRYIGAPIDWAAITGLASWLLILGVGVAIWQIRETRKSTNAQIAMDLFKELRSDRALEILRIIYNRNENDPDKLSENAKNNIEYILDRFEVLGILVDEGIVDDRLAMDSYGGASALRCWYRLHLYIKKIERKRGQYKVNYKIYTRQCLEFFIKRKFSVYLSEHIDVIFELQKPEFGLDPFNKVKLIPTLDVCVETQAKRLYNQTVSELLETHEDAILQKRMETIKLFLKTADFPGLRKESEKHLIKGKKVIFTVWQEKDKARWKMTVNQ